MEFCQAQIGTVKGAVCKLEFRKVIICQVAIVENAIFIIAFYQGTISIEGLVLDVKIVHGFCLLMSCFSYQTYRFPKIHQSNVLLFYIEETLLRKPTMLIILKLAVPLSGIKRSNLNEIVFAS